MAGATPSGMVSFPANWWDQVGDLEERARRQEFFDNCAQAGRSVIDLRHGETRLLDMACKLATRDHSNWHSDAPKGTIPASYALRAQGFRLDEQGDCREA